MAEHYGAPVKVNSVIKFGRYSLLFLGFLYGTYRKRYFTRRANRDRAKEAQKKIQDDIIKEKLRKEQAKWEDEALQKLYKM